MLTETFDISAIDVTGWKRLLLYKKEDSADPCRGPVYALSGGKMQPVSAQGWGQEEGQEMCKYLECGNYTTHSNKSEVMEEWWNKTYSCSGKTNIWECERDNLASEFPKGQLNITCEGRYHLSYKHLLFENSIFLAALPSILFYFF